MSSLPSSSHQTILSQPITTEDLLRNMEAFPFRQTATEDWYIGGRVDERGAWGVVIIKVFRAPHQDHFPLIIQRIEQLVDVWKTLSHPGILPVQQMTFDGPHRAVIHPPLVRQDLYEFLRTQPNVTAETRMRLMKEVLEALSYLHDHNVHVGVIWARSIMVDNSGHAILADIGHQYLLASYRQTKQLTLACRWLAPEIINRPDDTPAIPTAASDMHSVAATFHEMHTLHPPFRGRNDAQFVFQLQQGTAIREGQPDNMIPAVWQALLECWALDPSLRPTARQLLSLLESIVTV